MMTDTLRKGGVRRNLAIAAFTLGILVFPLVFLDEKAARVIFYWCGYVSAAGVIYEAAFRRQRLLRNPLPLTFFALGIVFTGWSVLSDISGAAGGALLLTAGKRMVLAFFILCYLTHVWRENILSRRLLSRLALASVATGVTAATLYGIVQGAMTQDRILLGINRATLTAYAYSVTTLALMTTLLQLRNVKLRSVLFVVLAALSLYVVGLTETRAAMAIHTLLIAVLATRFFWLTRSKAAVTLAGLAIAGALVANYSVIEARAAVTLSEIRSYQNNDDHTSLGSRFTMWKTGLLAFEHHPFGQTQPARNAWIVRWLDTHGNPDSFAITYLDVHLHNEFIQYASVFGITGVVVLACFYWISVVGSATAWGFLNPITVAALACLLYGMTDVLLTSVELIVVLCMLFSMMALVSGAPLQQSGNDACRAEV